MLNDEEIIARYFSHDEVAIAATSEKYGGQCYGISYNILRVREDAKECVSDSYLRVWNSDISSRYGFSQSKVKTSLSRKREKLRKFLEERGIYE